MSLDAINRKIREEHPEWFSANVASSVGIDLTFPPAPDHVVER